MNLSETQIYFVPILLGLIFGEILCQSAYHMGCKWRHDLRGYLVCLEHSVLYTAACLLFLYLFAGVNPVNVTLIGYILVGHYIVEKFPFTYLWLKYMKMEHNPLLEYFETQLGTEAVGTDEWFEHIQSHPTLQINEPVANALIFYIAEFAIVSRLLQFVVTFFTVVALDVMKYI